MFGYRYMEKEASKMSKRDRKNQDKEMRAQNKYVSQATGQMRKDREQARGYGQKVSQDLFNRNVQGLAPKQRSAMQYEADRQIQRTLEDQNRKLLGDQGMRGIIGKGGVGYAQQRDLQRMGMEAQGQATRDLDRLDADLALKKLAAMFNVEQGEVANAQLDKQLALDELSLADERRRQRAYEKQFNRSFSRV